MTDAHPANGGAIQQRSSGRAPFPAVRLLYALGFAILAWFAFWVLLLLSLVQFVVVLATGKVNEELKTFSLSLLQYLWELLAFVTFVRNEQPFPIGAFPRPGTTP
ncbi:MAG TPA: DUF4389 domain-containing protein [Rhizomicrobium sp.]